MFVGLRITCFFDFNHIFLLQNKINNFSREILELTLNNPQLIPSFFPWSWGASIYF